MKISLYKAICILILLPTIAFANNPKWKGKYTKEKKIKKVFAVNSDALLKINNSYGNLNITSWNENKVVIEVHIKTNGNNEDSVQDKLDEIDVAFDSSSSLVSAKTTFDTNSWSWGWSKKNVSMEINYTIKVPVNNNVDLENDYGSIHLDKINGVAKINCDYGRIDIGELNADGNYLNFDYTSNSNIDFIKSGKINADYSGYEVDKAGNLEISADYTSSKINSANNIKYNCDYGSINIRNADNIDGNGDYLSAKFGTLHGNVNIRSDYGGIKIDEIAADAGNIQIQTDYTGVKIGYNSGYHFDFKISVEYAGIHGANDFDFKIKREGNTDKYFEGHYGSSGKNKITINSDYGSISFNKI